MKKVENNNLPKLKLLIVNVMNSMLNLMKRINILPNKKKYQNNKKKG